MIGGSPGEEDFDLARAGLADLRTCMVSSRLSGKMNRMIETIGCSANFPGQTIDRTLKLTPEHSAAFHTPKHVDRM